MSSRKCSLPGALASILLLLCACKGGGGSTHNSSQPRTNIDLTVAGFSVSPAAADPEDNITVSGTIKNLGTETANPMPGDKFTIRFNLSKDGTFELKEQGFLEAPISDPIPGGGSLPFTYTAPYGGGDTLAIYGIFCNSLDCIPPETGVIGVKVDGTDTINELQEGNNFQFMPIDVVGTRVAATFGGCNLGQINNPNAGCDVDVSDPFVTYHSHRPCVTCGNATDIALPNELYRTIYVTVTLKGCTNAQTPTGGTCGGSWFITAATAKPGLPVSTKEYLVQCIAAYPDSIVKACSQTLEIRDPNY